MGPRTWRGILQEVHPTPVWLGASPRSASCPSPSHACPAWCHAVPDPDPVHHGGHAALPGGGLARPLRGLRGRRMRRTRGRALHLLGRGRGRHARGGGGRGGRGCTGGGRGGGGRGGGGGGGPQAAAAAAGAADDQGRPTVRGPWGHGEVAGPAGGPGPTWRARRAGGAVASTRPRCPLPPTPHPTRARSFCYSAQLETVVHRMTQLLDHALTKAQGLQQLEPAIMEVGPAGPLAHVL